jgi:hypothetical protein
MDDPQGQLRLRFAGLRLVREDQRAQVYAGRDFSGYEVTVAVLAGAAADAGTRRAFTEAAGRLATGAGPSVQSDLHATRPWLAVRHPEGPARVARLVAELARSAPPAQSAPPAETSVALAPLPVDPPLPVRPDPTFAPSPPPAGFEPVPGLPPPPPPPPPSAPLAPTAAPTRIPAPAPQARPPSRQRPTQRPAQQPRPAASPRPAVRPGRSPQSQQFPPAAVVALVVIGVLVLLSCVGSLF